MRPILEGKKLVAHNMSFDWKVAYIYDINANIVHDTMALLKLTLGAEKVNYPIGLKYNAKVLLHRDSLELSDLLVNDDWGETDITFSDLPAELVRLYACADTDNTNGILQYALQNDLTPDSINWYKSLNGGKKVIGIMHGVYMSSIYSNQTGVYKIWKSNKLFDAYIEVIADDYYVNEKLGINNSFFIPNMYTFDADKTPNSNLTYKNLMIMGRELDKIKGGLYGIKAMKLIVEKIPDAKLYFISSNYKIDFLSNLIKELDLTNNIEILHYTPNVTHYFLNSSILLCPSLSESFPMVMNEGKAHGLPIVAFNISYSPPYQNGVTVCEILNYTQMAEESIKLLEDYEYRKKKGIEAKESLKYFSNKDIIDKWDRLFKVLISEDINEYKKLQKYTYEKYYDEEKARDHLETNFNKGKIYNPYFCCHDFNDMLNITYINNIQGCKNQSLCKK